MTAAGTTPLTYLWSRSNDGGTTWIPISTATASSYTTPATVMSDNGSTYRVAVNNSAGTVTSTVATLTVNDVLPTIATSASASPNPVTVTMTTLSVLGAYAGGESNLRYTWSTTSAPSGASVVFTIGVPRGNNGSNGAKWMDVRFNKPGTYTFQVVVANQGGLSVTSSVSVQVIGGFTGIPLVAWWPCDEGTGTSVRDGVGTNNLTLTNIAWNAGRVGSALKFINGVAGAQAAVTTPTLSVGSQLSIAFWAFGSANLSKATSAIYATDASNNRVLNIHLPWSDGKIVWDAGNSGTTSYDRITKAATAAQYKGQWNHWVFTKNVTSGTMAIYLNGALFASGTGKVKTFPAFKTLTLGCSGAGTYLYDGFLDDVRIYNGELAAADVSFLYGSYVAEPTRIATTITVSPASTNVVIGLTKQFTATVFDQYAVALVSQPTLSWTVSGGGTISAAGLFTAGLTVGGPYTVTAAASGKTGTASVSVINAAPTVATAAAATPNPVTGTTTTLTVLGADDGGEANLKYTWATTGTPPAPVTFSANGTNAAKSTTATFTASGSYNLQMTITDKGALSATNAVSVTVNPVVPNLQFTLQPTNQSAYVGDTAFFSAVGIGTPAPTYQWQRGSSATGPWAVITVGTGATTVAYTTPTLSVTDNGTYFRCLATSGTVSLGSTPARLTVTAPPLPPTPPAVSISAILDPASRTGDKTITINGKTWALTNNRTCQIQVTTSVSNGTLTGGSVVVGGVSQNIALNAGAQSVSITVPDDGWYEISASAQAVEPTGQVTAFASTGANPGLMAVCATPPKIRQVYYPKADGVGVDFVLPTYESGYRVYLNGNPETDGPGKMSDLKSATLFGNDFLRKTRNTAFFTRDSFKAVIEVDSPVGLTVNDQNIICRGVSSKTITLSTLPMGTAPVEGYKRVTVTGWEKLSDPELMQDGTRAYYPARYVVTVDLVDACGNHSTTDGKPLNVCWTYVKTYKNTLGHTDEGTQKPVDYNLGHSWKDADSIVGCDQAIRMPGYNGPVSWQVINNQRAMMLEENMYNNTFMLLPQPLSIANPGYLEYTEQAPFTSKHYIFWDQSWHSSTKIDYGFEDEVGNFSDYKCQNDYEKKYGFGVRAGYTFWDCRFNSGNHTIFEQITKDTFWTADVPINQYSYFEISPCTYSQNFYPGIWQGRADEQTTGGYDNSTFTRTPRPYIDLNEVPPPGNNYGSTFFPTRADYSNRSWLVSPAIIQIAPSWKTKEKNANDVKANLVINDLTVVHLKNKFAGSVPYLQCAEKQPTNCQFTADTGLITGTVSTLSSDWYNLSGGNFGVIQLEYGISSYDGFGPGYNNLDDRWLNSMWITPDIVAAGNRITVSMKSNFVDEKWTWLDFNAGAGDYVRIIDKSGKDITLTVAGTANAIPTQLAGKVAIRGQRIIPNSKHGPTWNQTIELDLEIAPDVPPGLYHLDVRCGAVHAFMGQDQYKGTSFNGGDSWRMKEALKIIQLDWLTRACDGTEQSVETVMRSAPRPVFKALSITSMTISPEGHVAAAIAGTISDPIEGIIADRSGDLSTLSAALSTGQAEPIQIGTFNLSAPARAVNDTWAPYGDPEYAFSVNLSFDVSHSGQYSIDLTTNPNACQLAGNASLTFDVAGTPGVDVTSPLPINQSYENTVSRDVLILSAASGIIPTTVDVINFSIVHISGLVESYILRETAADSRIFNGSGSRGAVSLAIPGAVVLNPLQRDVIAGTLTINRIDGVTESVSQSFVESGVSTNVFQCQYVKIAPQEQVSLVSETLVAGTISPDVMPVTGLFRPVLLKVTGQDLPDTLPLTVNGNSFTMKLRNGSYVPIDDAGKVQLFILCEEFMHPPPLNNVLSSTAESMSVKIKFPGDP